MSGLYTYQDLRRLATRLKDDLNNKELVLLYAYNRTGKTRLSMEFKNLVKIKNSGEPAVLYFNAFTEDLFTWENDLDEDSARGLKVNYLSRFFDVFTSLGIEPTIAEYLNRYADFDFDFEYKDVQQGEDSFSKPSFISFSKSGEDNIKISRGEENIFIWCLYMAVCERVLDGHESYKWVKYLYIDDPISSLDDNNSIAVACDLARLLRRAAKRKDDEDRPSPIKVIFSSHHSLFFNVMCNEIRRAKEGEPSVSHKQYFLHRPNSEGSYTLRATEDTPYFHHVATLAELHKAADPDTGTLYTFHFNALRSIMEKTAAFFGHSDISFCLKALDDNDNSALFNRALNLLSHGKYAIHEPTRMGEDNQDLFRQILIGFTTRFQFDLPEIFSEQQT